MKRFKSPLIIFILSWMIAIAGCAQRSPVKTPKNATPPPPQANTERTVIAYEGEDGKTALEILKARARIRTSASQMGELVEEINGVNNGNGYYLIYYVNGAKANVGAGNYITKSGDKIEWKLIGPRK
jgi:predicted small lipoprotein YifL